MKFSGVTFSTSNSVSVCILPCYCIHTTHTDTHQYHCDSHTIYIYVHEWEYSCNCNAAQADLLCVVDVFVCCVFKLKLCAFNCARERLSTIGEWMSWISSNGAHFWISFRFIGKRYEKTHQTQCNCQKILLQFMTILQFFPIIFFWCLSLWFLDPIAVHVMQIAHQITVHLTFTSNETASEKIRAKWEVDYENDNQNIRNDCSKIGPKEKC